MAHDPVRVVVIGCGGVGSWFAHGLLPALEYGAPGSTVIFIDGDSYEPKNRTRQKFSKLGNKAQVLRADLAPSFTDTVILAKAAWIVSEGKEKAASEEEEKGVVKIAPSQILQEGDYVFPLVDNAAARALVFDAARKFDNIDVITGGNDDDLTGSVYHYCRRNGRDVTLHPAELHEELANPQGRNPGEMSCEERAKLDGGHQIITANMTVATLLLAKVTGFILATDAEKKASLEIVETHFDWALGQAYSYNWPADEEAAKVADEATAADTLVASAR